MAIDGTYNTLLKTPMGDQQVKLILKTEGNVLTGILESQLTGVNELTDGSVDGNELAWTVNAKTPMGPLKLKVTAAVDSDKITGKADSPFGAMPFEGARE
ncbi:MAG: hypothetical protein JW932_19860 [Deltaproteobacteria bacterium]|nr:hypothetical protein [Deltaproteobacteria bacterium]